MAAKQATESSKQARPGDTLLVIHAFEARSPDELSFVKGDRLELIERDDDFGDGWYLGKHLGEGRSGLFPEVYTRLAPQEPPAPAPPSNQVRTTRASSTPNSPPPFVASAQHAGGPPHGHGHTRSTSDAHMRRTTGESMKPQAVAGHTYETAPSPLNTTTQSQRTTSVPINAFSSPMAGAGPPTQRSISLMMEGGRHPEEGSPVLNETLSVIDEHITDLNTPRSTPFSGDARPIEDARGDFVANPAQRMSYINGNETDEEERNAYNRAEVGKWSADQVAEALEELGVEKRHCEIFLEQEITGEVLLHMDQATIFMKEFDLGVVGRRLRTWQKIKELQDEVKAEVRSSTQRRKDNRITPTSSMNGRHLQPGSPLSESFTPDGARDFADMSGSVNKSTSSRHSKTHSRDHGHSRRLSSVDAQNRVAVQAPEIETVSPHSKKPSLDRGWSMGLSDSPVTTRSSFLGVSNQSQTASTIDLDGSSDGGAREYDRGYLSGSELDGRKYRNVLKKREASSANHSRESSVRDLTAPPTTKRHSRFSSAGSFIASITGGKHYDESSISRLGQNDSRDTRMFGDSPVVTRLDYDAQGAPIGPDTHRESKQTASSHSSLVQPLTTKLATDSPAIRTEEKTASLSPTLVSSPVRDSTSKDSRGQSPSRAGSNTTSGGGRSMEMDQSKPRGFSASLGPMAGSRRSKNKKQTSAYTRGLLKLPPQEAMAECDYSGWMKKKSPSLIATWKPRLFVLRGRRLSYYYSENDTEEQGLIDISNHKVLAADDLLTGIHATVTGAKATPTSPANALTETMNEAEAAAQPDLSRRQMHDGIFIFKLVPPRAGLSRAVNFTKPTVHYFAVDNIKQGRLWMAALMKATIQLDSSKSVVTTYGQKTISLDKAKAMRQRPPNLQDDDENSAAAAAAAATAAAARADEGDDEGEGDSQVDDSGLNISGLNLSYEYIAAEANKPAPAGSTNGQPEPGGPASAPLLQNERPNGRQSTPARDAKNSLRLVRSLSGGISNRSHRRDDDDDADGGDQLSRSSTNASRRTPRSRARAASGATGTSGSIFAGSQT